MPTKPSTHKPFKTTAPRHQVASEQDSKTRKDGTNATGYGYKWQLASKAHLKVNPLCVDCEAMGRVRLAEVVDHIQAHRGDMVMFWDKSNWQSLCTYHHNAKTARGL